jgi:hypothetical protein
MECKHFLAEPTVGAEVYRRFRWRIGDVCEANLLQDPIEMDPRTIPLLLRAALETEAELEGCERGTGFCHLYWQTKKRILQERYGVSWKSPAEMNPELIFD